MPRPAGWTPTTPIDDVNLNANTKDVIGDLNSLNKIYFPNANLVSAINAVPSMMNKTFYVDVNGDDVNGDGSSTAPFQTIKKAVDSVPAGAVGIIYLTGGQTFTVNSRIPIKNKFISIISADNTNLATIELQSYLLANGMNDYYRFKLYGNSYLELRYCDLTLGALADPTANTYSGGFVSSAGFYNAGIPIVNINYCSANLGTAGYNLVRCGGGSINFLNIHNNITTNSTGYILQVANYTALYYENSLTIDNTTYKVAGIVRDANGVPRNIVSNIIL